MVQQHPEYEGPPQNQPNQPPQFYPPTYVSSYHPQPDPNTEKAKADFFNVAKWGVWTWIAVTVLPILLVLACCGFCVMGSAVSSVNS